MRMTSNASAFSRGLHKQNAQQSHNIPHQSSGYYGVMQTLTMSSLPPTLDFAATEEEICKKWKEEDTFKTQNKLSLERGSKEFTFYDGPPFATGLPHYGHILAGTIKDTVTRFAVMSGYYVERRAGWDCHGLPVEYEIDQKLHITHRNQVLEMGIDKYNETCRSIVTRYTKEWESTITRLGRWIDFENGYKTMDPSFMESVWWVFKQLFEKNLVYQGYKVTPYSTACATTLSNFEAGLNYKDVKDPAIVVSFPIAGQQDVSFVAWTTTPWTLTANIALCVNPEMEYVKILDKKSNKTYIIAKTRLPQLYPVMNNKKKWKPEKAGSFYEIKETTKGADLVGMRYKPIFDFFADTPFSGDYFQVVADSYVTDDAGTGVVHLAPAFGEDDYRVCLAHDIITKGGDIPCPVDDDGNFTNTGGPMKGQYVKNADELIIQLIKDMGRLVQKDVLIHSYPFCWRSDTPLIYKAVPSWFIKVEEIRDQVVENNKQTYWVPNEVKEGRFHNWLSDGPDWAVSRNRFWGTPIPIWTNGDLSEIVCVGSIDELAELSGVRVEDLHCETVDRLTIPSKKSPGTMLRRVAEVLDCWFESGSMPYAQNHYPFENKERWEKRFPADFIAEGLDQTRGWFYTLMVLSTALFGRPAFQNVIVNGIMMVRNNEGNLEKMSKSKKNYPDPNLVINEYGADAVRMYLLNSPAVRAENIVFEKNGIFNVVKDTFLPLYNTFRFFLQNLERWERDYDCKFVPDMEAVRSATNPTDVWIIAEMQGLIKYVHEQMKEYRLFTVLPALITFKIQLSNWYVRLNRDRLKGHEGESATVKADVEVGLQVLYSILLDLTILMAPFTPFLSEFLYQHLRKFQPSFSLAANGGGKSNPVMPGKSDSVHFLQLPQHDTSRLNSQACEAIHVLQRIVELGRKIRESRNIGYRTPVKCVMVVLRNRAPHVLDAISGSLRKYILFELNTWDFQVVPAREESEWVRLSLVPVFSLLGKKLGSKMSAVSKSIKNLSHEEAVKCMEDGKIEVEGVTLDAATELEPRFSFAKAGDQRWGASVTKDGSLLVAVDSTQDVAAVQARLCSELIRAVQQLRKSAGLNFKDEVEIFYHEEGCVVEEAVAAHVALFENKFKGVVPLARRFAPPWAVVLKTTMIGVGDDLTTIKLSITRPAMAGRDSLPNHATQALSRLEPASLKGKKVYTYSADDDSTHTLVLGIDCWLSTVEKVRSTKAVDW